MCPFSPFYVSLLAKGFPPPPADEEADEEVEACRPVCCCSAAPAGARLGPGHLALTPRFSGRKHPRKARCEQPGVDDGVHRILIVGDHADDQMGPPQGGRASGRAAEQVGGRAGAVSACGQRVWG